MNTKHTPTPWGYRADSLSLVGYYENGRQLVASFRSGTISGEDAAHIVRCVNAHDKLVAALRFVEATLASVAVPSGCPEVSRAFADLLDGTRAALAEAGA